MTRADQRKFHYIYQITRQDGKYYIGLHSTDNLDDGYFGSGQLLWKSIKKHGKEAHTKEILEFLPTRAELKVRERELVNEDTLKDPRCFNLALGGAGAEHTNESRLKISEGLKGIPKSQEHKDKIGAAQKGRPRSEQERINLSNGQKNKAPPSAETRAKLSEAGKNRDYSLEPERNAKISTALTGRKRDPETVKKMSESRKGKPAHANTVNKLKTKLTCPHCQKTGSLGNMKRWHFEKCKLTRSETNTPLHAQGPRN